MPAGYTLDKNNVPYKKRLVITQLPMLKVITGEAIQLIQELLVYYLITQQSNMTAILYPMAIDGLLISLIVDNVVISRQERVDKTGNRISSFGEV